MAVPVLARIQPGEQPLSHTRRENVCIQGTGWVAGGLSLPAVESQANGIEAGHRSGFRCSILDSETGFQTRTGKPASQKAHLRVNLNGMEHGGSAIRDQWRGLYQLTVEAKRIGVRTRPGLGKSLLTIVRVMSCLAPLAAAEVQRGSLEGYVFRETDGGPPRRPLTVELIEQGRTRQRATTRPDGTFALDNVRQGRYTIRARFNNFTAVADVVTIVSTGANFMALMLPKRRAGTQTFGTITADRLATQSDKSLQKKLRQASRLAEKQDYSGAARLYEEALAAGVQPEVLEALGLLYVYMGVSGKAFQVFEQAIHADPKYLLPYAHLASLYLEQRQYQQLSSVAKRALAVDPGWMTGHAYLAEAQVAEGNPQAALRSAETASWITRGRAPGIYLLLAKIHWARRDCPSARQNLERYLELNTSARVLPEVLKSKELLQACRFGP
jgi:hypothetical protein